MAWWIFQNLVTTAALAATVAIVCRFARIGPVARHALWVLVLVKFITPPLVVWPWSAPDPLGIARIDSRIADAGAVAAKSAETTLTESDRDIYLSARDTNLEISSPAVTKRTGKPDQPGSSAWSWLVAAWAAGSLCLLVIQIARLVRLARRVKNATPADSALEQRVKTLAHHLGIDPVPVVILPGSTSPVVWCLGRPQLLWPADLDSGPRTDSGLGTDSGLRTDSGLETDSGPWTRDSGLTPISPACIDGLIVHELAHVKRRDHIVGWIELVAGLVWWWNPLFWSVRSALREQAELACDAWVISALPNGRRAYAESLLALSSLGAAPSPSMAAVVGVRASSRRVLERRLVMIMKGRAPLRLPSAGLLTLAVMAVATLPAWATGATEDRQQQTQVAQQPAQPVQASQQPAQAVQATQTPAQPQAQQGQTKPAPTTTTAKPSPQAPATTHTIAVTQIRAAKPTTHTVAVTQPAHATPVTAQVQPTRKVVTADQQDWKVRRLFFPESSQLTDEGQKIVASLEAEREAIQKEADAKIEARRQATIKQLEALQDQYAKTGKLDEAVAIRDYLKAGGPGNPKVSWIIKRNP